MPYAMASRRSVTAPPANLGASVRASIAEYAESLRYLGKHGRVLVVALQKGFLSIFCWTGPDGVPRTSTGHPRETVVVDLKHEYG